MAYYRREREAGRAIKTGVSMRDLNIEMLLYEYVLGYVVKRLRRQKNKL